MSVAREFRGQGIVRGRRLLLAPAEAIAMISRAQELGVQILGVESLRVTESTTQPDMSHILDLGAGGPTSWSEATEFIRERAQMGLLFDVVADEDTADLLERLG